jgi:hypothetical protein
MVRSMRIETLVRAHPDAVMLQPRTELPPFVESIKGVRDVFVLAISANELTQQYSREIESALKAGTNFRSALLFPDNSGVIEALTACSPSEATTDVQIGWIRSSIAILSRLAESPTQGKLEVGLYRGLPTMSMVAYDIDLEGGCIQIEPHAFRLAPMSRPAFLLRANGKSQCFDCYKKVARDLWDSSDKIVSSADTTSGRTA